MNEFLSFTPKWYPRLMAVCFAGAAIVQGLCMLLAQVSVDVFLLPGIFLVLNLLDINGFSAIGNKKLAHRIEFLKGSCRERQFLRRVFLMDMVYKSVGLILLAVWWWLTEAVGAPRDGGWLERGGLSAFAVSVALAVFLQICVWINRKIRFLQIVLLLMYAEVTAATCLTLLMLNPRVWELPVLVAALICICALQLRNMRNIRRRSYYDCAESF